MSEEQLGNIKSPSGRTYEAKWNSHDKKVYVRGPGGGWEDTHCTQQPRSAKEAYNIAYAYVQNNKH